MTARRRGFAKGRTVAATRRFRRSGASRPDITGAESLRLALLLAALFVFLAGPVRAATDPAYIVIDVGRGVVLNHHDSDKLWPPASITKLMTAYLTFKALKAGQLRMTSPVLVTANALAEPPSKMGYKVGTVVTVDNALKMLIVRSANDIAVAIAETVGGSEARFVEMMNQEARRLGMNATNFVNPNGLPAAGQVTTARDLAVLSRAAWMEFPGVSRVFPDFGDPGRHQGTAIAQHPAGALSRHQRHEDRVHLCVGLQCGRQRHQEPPDPDGGRPRRDLVRGAGRNRGKDCSIAAFRGVLSGVLGQKLSTFQTRPGVRAAGQSAQGDL